MYYGTKSEEEFCDIWEKAGVEDPNLDIEIHLPTEIFQIVNEIYKLTPNKGQLVAYYMPYERVLKVESPEISLQYEVKQLNSWDVWNESWEKFRIYIPIEFLTKNKDNYIGAFAWLVNSNLVNTDTDNILQLPIGEQVYITTFENSGVGRVHTVQYS